jgi:NAD(P)-dependent dehydrogenase (short-subunit alcohol dehydrogenase family)
MQEIGRKKRSIRMTDPKFSDESPVHYEIRLRGWLDHAIAQKLFPGMAVVREKSGESTMRGPLPDQSALFGLLNQLRNLAIPLISVQVIKHDAAASGFAKRNPNRLDGSDEIRMKEDVSALPAHSITPWPYPAGEAVLVTGCSSGIGQATALLLAMRGFVVLATVRREADAERLRSFHLSGLEPICPVDLSRPDEMPLACRLIREALDRRGRDRLYAIVNNAGGGSIAPVELTDLSRFRVEMETRLMGPIALLQDLLPLVRKARGGRIAWIGTSGLVPIPYVSSIHACEFAMSCIADTLQVELSPWNIPNILIGCGGIRTAAPARSDRELDQAFREWAPEKLDLYARSLQKIRAGFDVFDGKRTDPDAVARVIFRALTARSPRRKYVVGHMAGMMRLLPHLPRAWVERILKGRI